MGVLDRLLDEKAPPNVVVTAIIFLVLILPTVLIGVLCGTLLETLSGWSFSVATTESQWQVFNWHPLLMTFAYSTMFGCAALSFKRLPISHNAAKYVHFGCQSVAVLCSILAIVAVHQFKIASANAELYIMHAWVGYVTFILFLLQYLLGAMSFLIPPPYPSVAWRRAFHPVHVALGCLLLVFTTTSIVSGIVDRMWIWELYGDPEQSVFAAAYMVSAAAGLATMVACLTVLSHHVGKKG
eukprot:CAMPEP_0174243046 /NCGR_PEP_ID=MMETSP0417-20130205/30156_1 /TAXON_ID=242541 /ORGANISM="Mayorella sp, Strain BSH-02190019" /LENGTH=239 /DNA_ID=CAMNT_0015322501 /DNA_START=30 /DNA_END=746 /DNA_ORIENTATION=-